MGVMIDERTIAQLEADGFTHLDAACAGCGAIVQYPFQLMRTRKKITDETTIAITPPLCLQALRQTQRVEVSTLEAAT